jgi:hypothetical protein
MNHMRTKERDPRWGGVVIDLQQSGVCRRNSKKRG